MSDVSDKAGAKEEVKIETPSGRIVVAIQPGKEADEEETKRLMPEGKKGEAPYQAPESKMLHQMDQFTQWGHSSALM